MVERILIAFGLMALCVVVHAFGVTFALRRLARKRARRKSMLRWSWTFIRLAIWMTVLHLVEITAWAWLFVQKGAMPDLQIAFYFSAATYTTTGYGDIVLPPAWRLVGSVESLTGILMCGWSTGFFFAAVSRVFDEQPATSLEKT